MNYWERLNIDLIFVKRSYLTNDKNRKMFLSKEYYLLKAKRKMFLTKVAIIEAGNFYQDPPNLTLGGFSI